MEYRPDKWEIIKFKNDKKTWYKVLGSWSGGYLDGDSWRLSSGLEEVAVDGDYYLMKNYSGSVYKVHKDADGMTGYTASLYNNWIARAEEESVEISIISLDDYLKESR